MGHKTIFENEWAIKIIQYLVKHPKKNITDMMDDLKIPLQERANFSVRKIKILQNINLIMKVDLDNEDKRKNFYIVNSHGLILYIYDQFFKRKINIPTETDLESEVWRDNINLLYKYIKRLEKGELNKGFDNLIHDYLIGFGQHLYDNMNNDKMIKHEFNTIEEENEYVEFELSCYTYFINSFSNKTSEKAYRLSLEKWE